MGTTIMSARLTKEAYFPIKHHDQVELFVEEIDRDFDISRAIAIDIHGTSKR